MKSTKNLPASVQAKLTNHARSKNRPFQEVLEHYAMERFLYRLSRSSFVDRFVLKGGLLLRASDTPDARPTRDVDLLGKLDNSLDTLTQAIRKVCDVAVEPDGMVFSAETVQADRTQEAAEYEGVQISFMGFLGKSRISMRIDVGFGDVMVPGRWRSPDLTRFRSLKLTHPARTPT